MVAGGSQIVGAARHRVGDPQGEPVRGGDELDVRAESAVFSGVPQMDRGALGADGGVGDAVGGDQGAVDDDVGSARGEAFTQHVGKFRRLGGEHVDAFVEVPVAGGDRDAGIACQGRDRCALPEPAQYQHRVRERGQCASAAAGTSFAAVDLQQLRQILAERSGNVERGRIGDHVGPSGSDSIFANPVLPGALRPFVIRYDPIPARSAY